VAAASKTVRITHWVMTLCFFAMLVTGVEIVISHPRFYWGEDGNVNMPALFQLPIPASRAAVQTGYGYVLPDQNGWSRYLHFQAGWVLVLTGLLYVVHGWRAGHFRRNLFPAKGELSVGTVFAVMKQHLRFERPVEGSPYNVLQRLTYLIVVFGLVPAMVWTGLAMSPAFTAGFPFVVDWVGGFESARTLHFFVTVALVLFLIAHIAMIFLAGFKSRMRAMTVGEKETV